MEAQPGHAALTPEDGLPPENAVLTGSRKEKWTRTRNLQLHVARSRRPARECTTRSVLKEQLGPNVFLEAGMNSGYCSAKGPEQL